MVVLNSILSYKLVETSNLTITLYDLVMAFVIVGVTLAILWGLKRLFKKSLFKRAGDQTKGFAVFQLVKYLIWIIVIFLILDTVGIKITLLLAGSTALLIGVGLGLQQVFKDLISGLFLLFEGNLKLGDVVELDGIIGIVKEIGFRTTKIESRDNIILIIPNSKFIEENVINWSIIEQRTRFYVGVGVAYGSDVELVKKILEECAYEHEGITDTPKPFVRFYDFGNSSLDFQLYFWTNNAFRVENIKSDLRFSINRKFKENGVTIPFPQRDVHIKE